MRKQTLKGNKNLAKYAAAFGWDTEIKDIHHSAAKSSVFSPEVSSAIFGEHILFGLPNPSPNLASRFISLLSLPLIHNKQSQKINFCVAQIRRNAKQFFFFFCEP
jgi:hypothetical protein